MKTIDANKFATRLQELFETMCFVLADPIPQEEEGAMEEDFAAHIRLWNEEAARTLSLRASRGFLEEVASGMLGIEPEDLSDEDVEATIFELANVACGELIDFLGGEMEQVECGLPEAGVARSSASIPEFCRAFDSMGELLEISVTGEDLAA